jgi:hypothetical protein
MISGIEESMKGSMTIGSSEHQRPDQASNLFTNQTLIPVLRPS